MAADETRTTPAASVRVNDYEAALDALAAERDRYREALEAIYRQGKLECLMPLPWMELVTPERSGRGAPLLDPPLDVSLTPDAALGQVGHGLREPLGAGELIGALPADGEHLPDLGGADEFHPVEHYRLTPSSAKRTVPLDTVKGGTMASKTKTRGRITYDNYFGHVCTCTAQATKVGFAGFEGEHGEHDWTTYENTVECDRSSGTESGSFAYHCTRCGASAWSGL